MLYFITLYYWVIISIHLSIYLSIYLYSCSGRFGQTVGSRGAPFSSTSRLTRSREWSSLLLKGWRSSDLVEALGSVQRNLRRWIQIFAWVYAFSSFFMVFVFRFRSTLEFNWLCASTTGLGLKTHVWTNLLNLGVSSEHKPRHWLFGFVMRLDRISELKGA